VPRQWVTFLVALLVLSVTTVATASAALFEGDSSILVGLGVIVVWGLLTPVLLWYLAYQGHEWPRWTLALWIVVDVLGVAADPKLRNEVAAVICLIALALLIWGWPRHASLDKSSTTTP
jgi:hypothetical protein